MIIQKMKTLSVVAELSRQMAEMFFGKRARRASKAECPQ